MKEKREEKKFIDENWQKRKYNLNISNPNITTKLYFYLGITQHKTL